MNRWRTPLKTWAVLVGLGLAVLALLVGGAARAESPAEGRAGRAEVRFLQGMIDHHAMAIDMADHCLEKTKSEAMANMVKLCQGVIDAQSAEIKTMRGWLLDWYNIAYAPMSMLEMSALHAPSTGHGGHGGTAPHTDPVGMMGMMAGLNRLEGRDYAIAWLEAMIDHHDDALHMSVRILKLAQHADLKALAENIIKAQSAEIAMMEEMLVALSK
jgi:uncharacterized protein (DUF305 family)